MHSIELPACHYLKKLQIGLVFQDVFGLSVKAVGGPIKNFKVMGVDSRAFSLPQVKPQHAFDHR